MKRLNYFISILILAMLFYQCSRNPVTGKKQLNLMSEAQEKQMGLESNPQVLAEFGKYDDPALQAFINEKGQEMAKISHRPDHGYTFQIIGSPIVNAFAVPGGYVYFTRGIMAHFNNEAEFAGVLGHEIGHITARHANAQAKDQLLTQVGVIGLLVISPAAASMAESLMQGAQLLLLKFSRAHESQSDELGVEYSTKIGYDAHQMAQFFQTIGRISDQAGARIPVFLSTHPDPGDRFNRVHKLAEQAQTASTINKASLKVNRDEYLRRIHGLMYGEDPNEGYVDGGVFYHPQLRFRFPVPTGWQVQNSPSQLVMAEPAGKAMMLLTMGQGATFDEVIANSNTQFGLTAIRSENRTVNGYRAVVVLASPTIAAGQQAPAEADKTLVLSYYIQKEQNIFCLHGVCANKDYQSYQNLFLNTMEGFNNLTDPNKINVFPEYISVVNAPRTATLSELLTSYGITQARLEEFAILNGMQLKDVVPAGKLFKVAQKGKA
ncbi:MAG: M48 family metalloprotease [Saprospiraceae bacterium]|jgi:predicted Zn-dependent protease|nr:M48 family metalloprotease [Saprospiraceae bacterium]MBK8282573.1 M48 family metalloprotease [Saprospiraceae bacterium]MBK9677545.1 M48 family metalloprotease [Saprospiraceae bacterium]MBK9932375.1 M48 family metalloprotease [Saprospiraceae bacterium]